MESMRIRDKILEGMVKKDEKITDKAEKIFGC